MDTLPPIRLQPSEIRDPATGLPALASLDNPTAVSLILGHLVLLVGDPNQPQDWSALAGADPASGRPVWAHFQEFDRPETSGVLVTLHDGQPYASGSRELTGGGFVEGATDLFRSFWCVSKISPKAVDLADQLLAMALRESP